MLPESVSIPFLCVFAASLLSYQIFRRKGQPKYPPGPATFPLIGNLLQFPIVRPWIRFTEWKKRHGDVVHLTAFGYHIVVLNSIGAVRDLLDKRSGIFSDRPRLSVISFLGGDFAIPMMPYGDTWRHHRSALQQRFRSNEVRVFRPMELSKAHNMAKRFMQNPQDFFVHIKNYTGGVTMNVAYGYNPSDGRDEILELADEMTHLFTDSLIKGTILQFIPSLLNLLELLPGIGVSQYGARARELVDTVLELPLKFVRNEMAKGTAKESFASEQLDMIGNLPPAERQERSTFVKEVAGNIYIAGTDTMNAALLSFIQSMARFPAIQKKAQDEIDSVIGHERLPEFSDRDSLPYVEALCREVTRYRPITPLGIPHATTEDTFYQGAYIPAGTVVIPNVWALTRDNNIYSNPEEFDPTHFLTADGKVNDDNISLSYGFGRRICVGRLLAEDTLWIAIAVTLATCDITKSIDENKHPVEIEGELPDNLVSTPPPFLCSITPRSEAKQRLLDIIDS